MDEKGIIPRTDNEERQPREEERPPKPGTRLRKFGPSLLHSFIRPTLIKF